PTATSPCRPSSSNLCSYSCTLRPAPCLSSPPSFPFCSYSSSFPPDSCNFCPHSCTFHPDSCNFIRIEDIFNITLKAIWPPPGSNKIIQMHKKNGVHHFR